MPVYSIMTACADQQASLHRALAIFFKDKRSAKLNGEDDFFEIGTVAFYIKEHHPACVQSFIDEFISFDEKDKALKENFKMARSKEEKNAIRDARKSNFDEKKMAIRKNRRLLQDMIETSPEARVLSQDNYLFVLWYGKP